VRTENYFWKKYLFIIFIVAPCILKSITVHSPTYILFPSLINSAFVGEWTVITFHSYVNHRLDCLWNVMAHGDAREEKWRGNKRMERVTSKRHMTAEQRLARAVQTLQADVHSSPASSRLNWRPCRFKWTRLFRRKWNLVSARVSSHFKRSRQCKYIKKARLLDTSFLYIFKLSVNVYNVYVGNNGIGTDKLIGNMNGLWKKCN
jgi:hypothetical protein